MPGIKLFNIDISIQLILKKFKRKIITRLIGPLIITRILHYLVFKMKKIILKYLKVKHCIGLPYLILSQPLF